MKDSKERSGLVSIMKYKLKTANRMSAIDDDLHQLIFEHERPAINGYFLNQGKLPPGNHISR